MFFFPLCARFVYATPRFPSLPSIASSLSTDRRDLCASFFPPPFRSSGAALRRHNLLLNCLFGIYCSALLCCAVLCCDVFSNRLVSND